MLQFSKYNTLSHGGGASEYSPLTYNRQKPAFTLAEGATHIDISRNNRSTAFTLAEVLITLGVIGIVAAMTLPTVINRANEKQWKVAYKKAYSSMTQAFLKMQTNDEVLDMTFTEGSGAPNIGENFKIMSKYFNTVKTCFDNNADECWVCAEGQAGYIYNGEPEWLGCKTSSYAFIDYSGIAWYLYSNSEWPVLVDVNGNKKPNRLGQDRFVMKFAANGTNAAYMESPDKIIPWSDFRYKTRWCPSGYCLYTTWLLE